ncbi:MAG: LPS-assembly protein LptD [Gammaproteobacteria bacterium]|nr:LPS-assembly protein LptD [Gammaproteobacteria bacterium]MBQ0839466.1 LPS-assembly protein LptD [Gammaproteobacteria bacterium]
MPPTFFVRFYHRHAMPFRMTALRLLGLSCGLLGTASALGEENDVESQALASNSHIEWRCDTTEDGSWSCAEYTAPGPAFKIPPHRYLKRRSATTKASIKADEPRVSTPRNLDWVDEAALSEAQKQSQADGCCGRYVEPPRDYPDAELNPDDAPLHASSTSTEAQDNVATMKGDVQISQGYRQVRSDTAVLDQDARTATLKGNVQLREPGLLLLGKQAHFNLDSGELAVDDATWVFHEAAIRGTAGAVARQEDGMIAIDNATYTTCEPGNNTWTMVSSDIAINPQTGIATAKHVRIKIKDVPVIYLPWIRYPVDDRRASGLLFPEVSFSDRNGFDYAQPIYLNLAPNYDATITPRYMQERGAMLELELRHLSRLTETILGGGWLGDDDGGDVEVDPITQLKPLEGEDRWLAMLDHRGGTGKRWGSTIDYTKVSDEDYFRDIGNATLEARSQTHLKQFAGLDYRTSHWNLGLSATEYQTLINNTDEQYQQLPRVHANGEYRIQAGAQDIFFKLNNQFTVFDHNDNNRVTGDRLRSDYSVSLDKQWLWGYFRPTFKLKHLSYDLDDPLAPGGDDSPSSTVPVGIIDAGLFFERISSLFGQHTQTLEPRIYYLNAKTEDQSDNPDFDTDELTFSYQQLFRDERFSGSDRISDAEQVTVALTTRLIDTSSGIERMHASIGQVFYLDDREVALNYAAPNEELRSDDSDLAAEFGAQFSKRWRLQSDILYNDGSDLVNKGSFSLRYRGDNKGLFNASYRYTREDPRFVGSEEFDADIEQADLSAYLPIGRRWSLIGRWNQDLTNSRELEVFGGVEYNSCCWRAAIIARHWLDRDDDLLIPEEELEYDDGIFFQIQLKGLAGTGGTLDSILSDGIYGYEPR